MSIKKGWEDENIFFEYPDLFKRGRTILFIEGSPDTRLKIMGGSPRCQKSKYYYFLPVTGLPPIR